MGARLAALVLAMAANAPAVELKPETRAAFERYVREAESRIETLAGRGGGFLYARTAEQRTRARSGAILTEPRTGHGEVKAPSGLIHDWVGAVYIKDVQVGNVIEVVQDYNRHREYYRPEVVDSRMVSRSGGDFQVSLRLLKKKVLTVVLDTDHAVHYERRGDGWWWSRSRSSRIAEVQDAGKPSERLLPPDTGHGYMWRLNSYWTFHEMDGGTYVEIEAISLSREVPKGLAWLIDPIVRSLPRESLANTLRATRKAVLSRGKE